MDNIERTNTLLSQAGLPLFPVDSNGFPVPGAVVRYFREQMVYIDDNGKERHWSQSFLAKQLHVAELAVRLMETRNEGLDSVERRQLLAALLHIPPALLGLASYDYLQDSLQGQKKTPSYMTSKTSIGMEELQLYHDGLVIFKEAYATSQLDETRIEPWIQRINGSIEQIQGKDKEDILYLLWDYHILAARMYYHDTLKFNQAFKHLQAATKIAQMVNNTELQTLVHYYTGELYLEQHNPLLAKDELDCALALSKGITTQTRGRILSSCAFIQASTGTDLASIINTQKLLDEAERYTSAQKTFVSFTHARYLGDRADTFIVLKQYGKALDSLDDAIEDANVRKRGLEYLNILRAECYIKKHKPECDLATALLYQVLEQNAVNPRIYRVQYVARLHKLLAASPYGTSPEVADLGMALRAIQLKKS